MEHLGQAVGVLFVVGMVCFFVWDVRRRMLKRKARREENKLKRSVKE